MSSPVHTPTERAWSCLTGEHRTLAAVLQSLRLMLRRGPGDAPEQFFDIVRAMLFDPLAEGGDPRFERLFSRIVRRAPAPIGVGPA